MPQLSPSLTLSVGTVTTEAQGGSCLPKVTADVGAGEGVYANQALDLWTFDPMTLAPWNGQGQCPVKMASFILREIGQLRRTSKSGMQW